VDFSVTVGFGLLNFIYVGLALVGGGAGGAARGSHCSLRSSWCARRFSLRWRHPSRATCWSVSRRSWRSPRWRGQSLPRAPRREKQCPPARMRQRLCAASILLCWLRSYLIRESQVGWRDGNGAPIPVPESEMICGLPSAFSAIVSVAARVPAAVGPKITLMLQLTPGATLAPQVSLSVKSPGFAPLTEITMFCSGVPPWEVRVTLCGALKVPTVWLGKLRLVGKRATTSVLSKTEILDCPSARSSHRGWVPICLSRRAEVVWRTRQPAGNSRS
jgi:hypothetical protein